MPFFISAALIVITCLWILTLSIPPSKDEQASDGLTFTSLPYEMQWPSYIKNKSALLLATDEQELANYAEKMKVTLEAPIDFAKYDVLFALYTSDGCGLEVDRLSKSADTLRVHLELPAELRDKHSLNCTTVEQYHLNILQIEKQPIQMVTFMQGENEVQTSFNILDIDPLLYGFELLINPEQIDRIEMKSLAENEAINITNQALKNELSQLMWALTEVQGIANMTEPQYEITITSTTKDSQKIYLWLTQESDTITLMSSRNTEQLYTIPKVQILYLLEYFQ